MVRLKIEHAETFDPGDDLRVLMVDSDHIIVFQPQADRDSIPHIKRFLKGDVNDFETVNYIYAEYFKENPPARSCVQVAALPKGALMEVEAVALK